MKTSKTTVAGIALTGTAALLAAGAAPLMVLAATDAVPQAHGCDKLRIGIALFRHHPKPGIPGFLCRRISFFHLLQVTVIVLRIHDVRRICFPKSSQKLLFHQKSPFLILLFLS